jgi:peptidoglycan/xylan/chitin deacetylase (PgdA/CDA1 family)
MKKLLLAFWPALFVFCAALGAPDPLGPQHPLAPMKLAVTIDDIPANGDLIPPTTRMGIVRSVLAALRNNGVKQSYGFANHFDGMEDVAKEWLAAGYPLGNHTYDHLDLGNVSPEVYIANIEKMDQALATLAPFSTLISHRHVFRYPFLQEGETLAKRDAVRSYLVRNNYRIAEVTVDYEDWVWNAAYLRCLRQHDDKSIVWLKEHVVDAAERNLRRSRALSRKVLGKDIAQILLLHDSAFNAVMFDEVLKDFRARGVQLITVDQALADPAYKINPNRGFPFGLTFLEQLAAAHNVDINQWDEKKYSRDSINRVCVAK